MRLAAVLYAVLIAAAWFAVSVPDALHAGIGLVYTLDDPYIHLALAQRIAHGLYGINPGEPASPASSILFPLLLVPLAGLALDAWVPLVVNGAAFVGSIAIMARIWLAAGGAPAAPATLTLAGALALNWLGIAFTGLEHSLHVLATLAVVLGVWRVLTGRRVAWWLVLALVAGPALRYEGLAVSGAAIIVLWNAGETRAALGAAAAIAALMAGFSLFLVAQGLPPLPSSVLVKQAGGVAAQIRATLREPSGWLLIAATLAFAGVLTRARDRATTGLALLGLLVAAAHAIAGRYGWLARYEVYALSAVIAAGVLAARVPLAALLGLQPRRSVLAVLAFVVALVGAGSHLLHGTLAIARASRNTAEQQVQMRRLVVDHLRAAVGVHDIGLVSYGNPAYVLDYWGLASDAMRRLRTDPQRPRDWMERAARAHGVDLAMLYERVLGAEIPPGWIVLGRLHLASAPLVLEDAVTFYATRSEAVPLLEGAIAAWAPGLPAGVRFVPAAR
jgi:hypothetical protein